MQPFHRHEWWKINQPPVRPGISLLELLIVLGVIALLVALLVPAVQSARQAARKTQCLSNLRQVGIALSAYHADHVVFPPAAVWGEPWGESLGEGRLPIGVIDRVALEAATPENPDRMRGNWLIMLLPQLDQANLWQQYDGSQPISAEKHKGLRETSLPVLRCPDDTGSPDYFRDQLAGTMNIRHARGNYAMNLGPGRGCIHELQPDCEDGFHVDDPNLAEKNAALWGDGIGGFNRSFSMKDVTSGTSQFVMVDEIRAGIHPLDPRGSWALGYVGASLTARHGILHRREDASGPNNQDPSSDDIVGCFQMSQELGGQEVLRQKMPCHLQRDLNREVNAQATARSRHPGGVHVLTADGAAHFVSDLVSPDVWYYLHIRHADEAFEAPF